MIARLSYFSLLFAAAIVAAFGIIDKGVETELLALVGARDSVLSQLGASNQIRVLCDTPEAAAKCRAVFKFDPEFEVTKFRELVLKKGKGLLAEKTADELARGEVAHVRKSIMRRDYFGVGLFSKTDDPNYFLNDFVLSLKPYMPKPLKDGQVLLTAVVKPDDNLAPLVELAEHSDAIALSGSPFHTFLAREATKREVNLLSIVSLIAIVLIGFWIFRSFWFVLPTVLALSAGFVFALAVVVLMPGRPHALTLLFGTSLLGLGVDYCYHALSHDFEPRSLLKALVTTVISFSPLFFSGVAVLMQMAAFTIVGLISIYALVTLCFARYR